MAVKTFAIISAEPLFIWKKKSNEIILQQTFIWQTVL